MKHRCQVGVSVQINRWEDCHAHLEGTEIKIVMKTENQP